MDLKIDPKVTFALALEPGVDGPCLRGAARALRETGLHIANLAQDGQIIQMARNAAEDYLRADPQMETPWGRKMAAHIREIFDKQQNWGLIS